ncbi:hypothetical protein AYO38_11015 [bacterium SCGC AG-212-C10]|nr:hypothetical protein AYO38_11015 [bacterium SCGC AG-212-C10]
MAQFRATVVSFDAGTWRATLRFDGSAPQAVSGVRTARNIPSAEMTSGRKVLVDTGDHGNADDMVVFGVWS